MRADSATAGVSGPADSNGGIPPVPTRAPCPERRFGGLAPAALPARRLPQLHRIRNLYRVAPTISQFFTVDKGKNVQKWGAFPLLRAAGK